LSLQETAKRLKTAAITFNLLILFIIKGQSYGIVLQNSRLCQLQSDVGAMDVPKKH
jgi:hypothetical protein